MFFGKRKQENKDVRPPLQALLMAGEEMRDDVMSGRKTITIREGWRDYQVDKPVLIGCHILNWATMKIVCDVCHKTLREVTHQELLDDKFESHEEVIRYLRRWYPAITLDSRVTVIRWRDV